MVNKLITKIFRESVFYFPIASISAYVIGSLYAPITNWSQLGTAFIISSVFYIIMRFVMGYAVEKILLTVTPVKEIFSKRIFIVHTSIRLLSAALGILLSLWVAEVLTGIDFLGEVKTIYVQLFIGLLITLVITMSFYTAQFYREMEKKITDVQSAKQMALKSELKALQAQVNPHFLFNTLNSISALIPTDPGKADSMIQKLADVFRYVLVASEKDTVTLKEELQFINNYLDIEKTRFDEELKIEHRIDPETLLYDVPSLLLHPIVENALKHGISKNLDGGTITLSSNVDNGRWKIIIEDDGEENDRKTISEGLGIGLKNVNERIKKTYGDSYGVEIERAESKGMKVILTLPRNSK